MSQVSNFFNVLCPVCCVSYINPFTFEAGHIIPHSLGGESVPENLIPICRTCNRGMSNKNMRDYAKEVYHRDLPEIWSEIKGEIKKEIKKEEK